MDQQRQADSRRGAAARAKQDAAARARRLASEVLDADIRKRMLAYADDLDGEADALTRTQQAERKSSD